MKKKKEHGARLQCWRHAQGYTLASFERTHTQLVKLRSFLRESRVVASVLAHELRTR